MESTMHLTCEATTIKAQHRYSFHGCSPKAPF